VDKQTDTQTNRQTKYSTPAAHARTWGQNKKEWLPHFKAFHIYTVCADPSVPAVVAEDQTTAWNGTDFPILSYPFPLRDNQTEKLFFMHTLDKRQTSPGTWLLNMLIDILLCVHSVCCCMHLLFLQMYQLPCRTFCCLQTAGFLSKSTETGVEFRRSHWVQIQLMLLLLTSTSGKLINTLIPLQAII